MVGHVVANKGIGANSHMVYAHKLDHIVVVVQDTVDVLMGVITQGVGYRSNGDDASFFGAGDKLIVLPRPPGGPQGMGGVMAVDDGGLGVLNGVHGGLVTGVRNVDGHTQVVHAAHHFHTEVCEPTVVTFVESSTDVVLEAVGKPGNPDAQTVKNIHPMQDIADGQVLHRRENSHFTLIFGLENFLGAGDFNRLIAVFAQIGKHHPNLVHQVLKGNVGDLLVIYHASEQVGRGHGGPSPVPGGLITPLVVSEAQVLDKVVHVLGADHGVLVEVNHHHHLHQLLVPLLLLCLQRNGHGGNTSHLLGQRDTAASHPAPPSSICRGQSFSVELVLKGKVNF